MPLFDKNYEEDLEKEIMKPRFADESGININAQDRYGCTLLHIALEIGALHLVKRLLQFGADFDIPDSSGVTPRSIAEEKGYHYVAKYADDIIDIANKTGKDYKEYYQQIINIEPTELLYSRAGDAENPNLIEQQEESLRQIKNNLRRYSIRSLQNADKREKEENIIRDTIEKEDRDLRFVLKKDEEVINYAVNKAVDDFIHRDFPEPKYTTGPKVDILKKGLTDALFRKYKDLRGQFPPEYDISEQRDELCKSIFDALDTHQILSNRGNKIIVYSKHLSSLELFAKKIWNIGIFNARNSVDLDANSGKDIPITIKDPEKQIDKITEDVFKDVSRSRGGRDQA